MRPKLGLKALEPKCAGVFSVTIGLLSKSHGTPHYFGSNLINLLNCKQEIRQYLSDNNETVVLPDQLLPAPPIALRTTYAERQPLRPIFRRTSPFRPAIYFIRFISPFAARLYLLLPIALSIFYQRRRVPLTLKTQLHLRLLCK